MPYITSTERLSREEGRQTGLQEGREEGLRDAILDILQVRFPEASLEPIRSRLALVHGEETLRGLHRKALRSGSTEEFLSQLPG